MAPEVVEEDFSRWAGEERRAWARGRRLMQGVEPPCMRIARRTGTALSFPGVVEGAGSLAEVDMDERR